MNEPGEAARSSTVQGALPLSGIRVLDITAALAGPQATYLLGALGAEVIKVDAPGGSDMGRLNPPYVCELGVHFDGPVHVNDVSLSALSRLRNKKSITINAKDPDGKRLLARLAAQCDVVVHNIRSSSVELLGIDYESLREENPELIYCAISAFGDNAVHGEVGMDVMVQALSGLMAITGERDGPPMRVGIPIADFIAPLYACIAVLAALRSRDAGASGQQVSVSMLDVMTSLVASEHFDVLEQMGMPVRTGNSLARMGPFGSYRTKDGYVALAASQDQWCHRLFQAMGRPELITDRQLGTRGGRATNSELMDATIEAWSMRLTSVEMVRILRSHEVPCAEVRGPSEAIQDEDVRARGAVLPLASPATGAVVCSTGGVPIRLSGTTLNNLPARPLGGDTDDVLGSLMQLDTAEIETLRQRNVV